ncbi:hypothetical protein PSACC_00759 [Paramicrosporidium saccamoebae]|uniref:CAF1B/HIR1 beta-propeller domain-containing protein n=1 Tax=Paramicrosporidium saccamoebae TaxID=1246581 RepID=A0A2H9TNK1_9FUNG|nr:hypothetical protein PSACC_00759 [Paramicrosporidium saccamoebae]
MLAKVLRIHWHDKLPVFSVDFDRNDSTRMVWKLASQNDGEVIPEYCATLSRHSRPVNCVRFASSGTLLASAGDGGTLIIWRQSEHPIAHSKMFGEEDESSEYWAAVAIIRVSDREDIYDLAWSPDDRYVLIGLTDNTAQIWELSTLSESCDRSVKIWKTSTRRDGTLQALPLNKLVKSTTGHYFHDETLVSFFRRPAFTPDGGLVILPAGNGNCFYIQSRSQISGTPVAQIGGFDRPVLGVRCNPRFFQLEGDSWLARPYRMVYAVFTMDMVAIFDTRQSIPIATCRDLHYGSLTDASWSADGYTLLVASTDGFCSLVSFSREELGETLPEEQQREIMVELNASQIKRVPPQFFNVMADSSRLPSSDPIDVLEVKGYSPL